MVYNYDIVRLGDGFYFGKWKHQDNIFICTIEASCLDEAKRKIVTNLKQKVWTSNGKYSMSPRSEFEGRLLNVTDTGTDLETSIYKPADDDTKLPKIWEVKKLEQPDGSFSWQTIKHDKPLMDEVEAKKYILEQTFQD
jgi:hypothetical protein